jgi:hypothetical protein
MELTGWPVVMATPYNKSIIVSVFVRIATAQANPKDYLLNLLLGNFTVVTGDDATVLTANTTGGTSSQWQLPANMSRMDIMEIAELALRNIETGIDQPVTTDANGNQLAPFIQQTKPSQRILSYGRFGNIQR